MRGYTEIRWVLVIAFICEVALADNSTGRTEDDLVADTVTAVVSYVKGV